MNNKNINQNNTTNITITCKRCGSKDLYKYGKQQKTNKQKYKCKNCGYQSPMDREYHPKSIGSPHGHCPKCGQKLQIRKTNKSTIQLRCRNPLCRYSTSRPINLKKFIKHMLKLSDDYQKLFTLPKFLKYPHYIITHALKLFYDFNLSLRHIEKELKLHYTKAPTYGAVYLWITKFSYYFSLLYNNYLNNIPKPINSKIWLIDETVIDINNSKYHLFTVLDYESRFLLSWYLSPTKDTQAALKVLQLALNLTKSTPSTIISDRAQNFSLAIQILFHNSIHYIKVNLYSHETFSNNRLERFYSTIKSFFKKRKYPKSYLSAFLWLTVLFFIYNFIRQHSSISSTPANYLKLNFYIKDHLLEDFILCLALKY